MPFPYARLIVGTRHCRLLAVVSNINSAETGFDITSPLARAYSGKNTNCPNFLAKSRSLRGGTPSPTPKNKSEYLINGVRHGL